MINKHLKLLAAPVLLPLSIIYGLIVRGRYILYKIKFLNSYRSKLPIISVGNISVGGNGKTPLAMYLSTLLRSTGHRAVILSRGYKGREVGPSIVLPEDLTSYVGDEPKLMACRGHVVVVSKNKVAGVKFIEERELGNVIILDDGLQSRSLNRDLEILSVEVNSSKAVTDIKNGHLLPYGVLRESLSGVSPRIDGIVVNIAAGSPSSREKAREILKLFSNRIPNFTASVETTRVEGLFSKVELPPGPITLLSSIAKPEKVIETLSKQGFTVKSAHFFRDHHEFSKHEVLNVLSSAMYPIVCTEKDGVKLKEIDSLIQANIYVASINLSITPNISDFILSVFNQGTQ